jgi:hypothetical protein
MEPVSRRSFLAVTAGAAGAAGAAVLIANPSVANATESDASSTESPRQEGTNSDASGVVLHVRDGRSGDIAIYSADSEVIVKDKNLSDAIARAAKGRK